MKTLLTTIIILFSLSVFAQDSTSSKWETISYVATISNDTTWQYGKFYNVADTLLIPKYFIKIKVQYRTNEVGIIQQRFIYYK